MKHTIEALSNLKDKIQPEHYRLLCDAMIKDIEEERAQLRAQIQDEVGVIPAPCDRKAIWQNVAIRCESQVEQEQLVYMARRDGVAIEHSLDTSLFPLRKFVVVGKHNLLSIYSGSIVGECEYTYTDFLTHYNTNQCK